MTKTSLDISAMGAVHAAAALQGEAQEFITLEHPEKPLCRPPRLRVVSPHP